jgi:hypothetical protein
VLVENVRIGLDDGVHALAEVLVRQADGDTVDDARVRDQGGLDLRGVHVRATRDDRVSPSVCQEQVALIVHPAKVSGGVPSIVAFV